jgi:tetratricopeptide (TPR) repeat protein
METISQFPALILFAQRAQAVRSNFTLDASNIQAVTSICTELDGLPLAIELMAARMRLMTPQNLLEHWDRQFILSADGMRAASPRQKNLNAAIAWSYNLLSNGEQKFFAHLSVFSGGFTLQDVETIFLDMFGEQSISALLTSLLDKSLLQPAFNQEARDQVRFTMLVTIQHFALSCLQSMGDEREARDQHLAYFLELAEEGKKEIQGPKQAAWLHRLASTRDNLRSALDWAIESGQTEKALKMASHLSWFWFRRSDLSEGRQWLGKVAGLPSASQYPGWYSYVLAQLAFHIWLQSGPKPARPAVEQALSIARANDDKWNVAWALIVLGLVLTHEGDFKEAQSTIEKGKALFGELRDKWGYANATISLALGTYIQEELVISLAQHQEALTAFRKLGDIYFESVALRFIGIIQARQGNFASGIAALREALMLAQRVDSKYEIAAVLKQMCDPAQAQGNLVRAVHLYCASRTIFDSIGTWQQEDEAQFQDFLITCRARLDESAFAEAVEQGRTMTTEQAIAYALEDQE